VARYTLPAPIAIDKNIRKAILSKNLFVITLCHTHPAYVREIAIYIRMQVQQLGVAAARVCGTGQHSGPVDERARKVSFFEFIGQNAPQRSHIVLFRSLQPQVFGPNQSSLIF